MLGDRGTRVCVCVCVNNLPNGYLKARGRELNPRPPLLDVLLRAFMLEPTLPIQQPDSDIEHSTPNKQKLYSVPTSFFTDPTDDL